MPEQHRPTRLINRAKAPAVALETTLLVHGLPPEEALTVADQLDDAVAEAGSNPALVGVVHGSPVVGMTRDELKLLTDAGSVPKLNTSNLGHALFTGSHGATTVSTTMELAERAGIRVFATGGIGGVHRDYHLTPDISADLFALTRHRVAVVTSGCKNILDIPATREMLETLGIPVVGYRTDVFPAFYQRQTHLSVDATFDNPTELAAYLAFELARHKRGIVVANPIPESDEIAQNQWDEWLQEARNLPSVKSAGGRDATPALLAEVHRLSAGRTVDANIALAVSNAGLAGQLAAAMR
ncbi:MAG: pseudouridine-5'-phosphate glycosidase [Phycisphaerales bacterium]|nr:pseudouridine-5'-phosphate glycosidase [Phycisphaerales bacterium]MCB9835699.1 pseudouridine-5'-phosphate glycosidase [Phycisphaera sp.]